MRIWEFKIKNSKIWLKLCILKCLNKVKIKIVKIVVIIQVIIVTNIINKIIILVIIIILIITKNWEIVLKNKIFKYIREISI